MSLGVVEGFDVDVARGQQQIRTRTAAAGNGHLVVRGRRDLPGAHRAESGPSRRLVGIFPQWTNVVVLICHDDLYHRLRCSPASSRTDSLVCSRSPKLPAVLAGIDRPRPGGEEGTARPGFGRGRERTAPGRSGRDTGGVGEVAARPDLRPEPCSGQRTGSSARAPGGARSSRRHRRAHRLRALAAHRALQRGGRSRSASHVERAADPFAAFRRQHPAAEVAHRVPCRPGVERRCGPHRSGHEMHPRRFPRARRNFLLGHVHAPIASMVRPVRTIMDHSDQLDNIYDRATL